MDLLQKPKEDFNYLNIVNRPLEYGVDVLPGSAAALKQQQVALVTNNAALSASGELSRLALLRHSFHIKKLFSPEHGITVTGADGEAQEHSKDIVTGLPVVSLYGDRLAPSEEDLHDIDIVLFDIPDIGCRFYTYLWTMTYVMEACAQYNKPLIILDRPNPIGAQIEHAEGPFLDEQYCSSFIGRWNIPLKHACTLGELALYFAATRIPALKIEVIPVKNYQRFQYATLHFPFVPTSPAIQNLQAAMLYPGTGLLEGVNINEARGTSTAFTMLGAPWINGTELCDTIQELRLPGLAIQPVSYKTVTPPYTNEICFGVHLTVTDPPGFRAVHTGITILQTIAALYPHSFEERLYPTHANPSGSFHLDKLLGIQQAFHGLSTICQSSIEIATDWHQTIQPYLLYS